MKKLLLFLFAMLTICSCDVIDDDGRWERMKWEKTDYPTVKVGNTEYINVPVEGGTYIFHCINYQGFWLSDMWFEKDGTQWHSYDEHHDDPDYERDFEHYFSEWIDVKAKRDGVLEVVFQPNTGAERKAGVGVTAGDIFDTFSFVQSAGE